MYMWVVGLLVWLFSSSSWIADALSNPSLNGDVLRNKNTCTLCEEFTGEALGYIGDNKTLTEIIDVLHKSCTRAVPFKQEVNLCEEIALLSLRVKEEKCHLCRQVVSQVLEKFKDPDTQMDIIQILLKACKSMESYTKKCKRIVYEYGPLILANAEQFLETRDVCVAMHACRSSEAVQHIVLETVSGHSSS